MEKNLRTHIEFIEKMEEFNFKGEVVEWWPEASDISMSLPIFQNPYALSAHAKNDGVRK